MTDESIKINSEERSFLRGPRSRPSELWFAIKIFVEFLRGFRVFHFLGPCVTVFGSARYKEDHDFYKIARKIGSELASMGFTVMTGGGPGLMEAANRGAKDVGGKSVGCNIVLSMEQKPNAYLDKWVTIRYFFIRKVLLSKYSYAFVVLPGGYGTLDEFFEAVTLIQTNKIKHFPVVLIGKVYHQKLYEYLLDLVESKTIEAIDLNLFLLTDDIEEAMVFIEKNAIIQFNLRKTKSFSPHNWLGENG